MRPIDDEKRQMTANEAVNALERIKAEAWDEWIGDCEDYRAFDLAIQALQRSTWIPCSERLPEEGVPVLGTFKFQGGKGCLTTERIIINGKERWSASCGLKPIAWMPLPEPWKGADDEQ